MKITTLLKSNINGYYAKDDPHQRLSVNDLEARLIGSLVNGLFVLEIGTGLGVSTRALAAKAKTVVTVDPDPWVAENIHPALKDLHNVIFMDKMPEVGKFDAVFVDGAHDYESVANDIEKCKKIASDDCVFIFHDSKYKSIAAAIGNYFTEWIPCHTAAGIGLAWL